MPDREFIHCREDVRDAMRLAEELGLHVLPDVRFDACGAVPLSESERNSVANGVFHFYRDSWAFGAIAVMQVEGNEVTPRKYVVRARTNLSPITLYFHGERVDAATGLRILGGGTISFKREWLAADTHEMRPTPSEVADVYKELSRRLLSRCSVLGGVHRYYLCNRAETLVRSEPTLAPFDFILWPPALDASTGRGILAAR